MRVKPIPLTMLIHKITYSENIGSDGWDGKFAEGIEINNVRVIPRSSLKRTSTSISDEVQHVIFVDRTYSSKFPAFKKDSKIMWDKEYELAEVNPIYDTSNIPHHYELGLK